MSRIFLRSAVWLLGLLAAVVAFGQTPEAWVNAGYRHLFEQTPAPPELFLVADDLAAQLATPAGRQTVAFLREAEFLDVDGELHDAWAQLASSLGLSSASAFERLLGDRVLLVCASSRRPVEDGWALATRVDIDDIKLLFRKLEPIQRGVVAGRAVFSIERGAIDLAVLPGDQGDVSRWLVLTESGSAELFPVVLRGLERPEARQWLGSVWLDAPTAGFVAARFAVAERGPVVASGWAAGCAWRGELSAPGMDDPAAGVALWSSADADAALADAPLGLVGSFTSGDVESLLFTAMLGLSADRLHGVFGDAPRRSALRAGSDDAGRGVVVVAAEYADGSEARADDLMAGLIGALTGDAARAPRFGGRVPAAVRVAPVDGPFARAIAGRLGVERLSIAWGFRRDPSWMAAAVGPVETLPEAVGVGLAVAPQEARGELAAAGMIRPARLAGLLERAAGLDRPVVGGASRITSVRWASRPAREGVVEASIEIQMHCDD